jgi:hypothetical protein
MLEQPTDADMVEALSMHILAAVAEEESIKSNVGLPPMGFQENGSGGGSQERV